MRAKLIQAYSAWLAGFDRQGIAVEDFNPLCFWTSPATGPRVRPESRVLVLGQETWGWGWGPWLTKSQGWAYLEAWHSLPGDAGA